MTHFARTRMRRSVLAGGLLAGLVVTTTAQAESPRHFTYAATSGGYWFFDDTLQAQDSPAGRPAAFGIIRFVPTRSVITLRLDDAAVAAGKSVPVTLYQDGVKTGRRLCLRDGETRTLTGLLPQRQVSLFVQSAADDASMSSRCDTPATAGSAYVGL